MYKVYKECWKVLKDKGLLILILKPFIRNRRLIDLPGHTVKLCEKVGFRLVDKWLFRLPTMSFWRVLERKKWSGDKPYPIEMDYEWVLVFNKITRF